MSAQFNGCQFNGYQAVVENSPDAISLIGIDGAVIYSSSANLELLGYTPSALLGRDILELVHPDDREHASRSLQAVIDKSAGRGRWDARVRRRDGDYCWVESTAANLLQDVEVKAIVMHQRDIHERRAAEEKSRVQAEELIRSICEWKSLRTRLRTICASLCALFRFTRRCW